MIKQQDGFSLVELLITMVIFVLVIAAGAQVFTGLLTQFKQQSKIAETNIEGIIGLEMIRRDIEHAGYGLPWNLNSAAYNEAVVEPKTPWIDRDFNDGPPDNPARGTDVAGASNPPGGIRSGNGYALNGSDVLVIKAVNVAVNSISQRWTYLNPGNTVKEWTSTGEMLDNNNRVIVLILGTTRTLALSGGYFYTTYNTSTDPDSLADATFSPADNTETRIVYGIDPDTNLIMPFNRADYYVRVPPTADLHDWCANGTGVLYKGPINQSDGKIGFEYPLLDCVADMQVVYELDTDNNGIYDTPTNDISTFTAQQIRDQVREVRVFILAHEGQIDRGYTFNNFTGTETCATCIRVGESSSLGRDFNLTAITDYLNYRWKVYRLVVKLNNLR